MNYTKWTKWNFANGNDLNSQLNLSSHNPFWKFKTKMHKMNNMHFHIRINTDIIDPPED